MMSDWTELVKKTAPPPTEKYPILKLSEGEHQIKFLTDSPRIINTTTLDGKPVQKAIFDVELVEDGQKYALFTAVAGPLQPFRSDSHVKENTQDAGQLNGQNQGVELRQREEILYLGLRFGWVWLPV